MNLSKVTKVIEFEYSLHGDDIQAGRASILHRLTPVIREQRWNLELFLHELDKIEVEVAELNAEVNEFLKTKGE